MADFSELMASCRDIRGTTDQEVRDKAFGVIFKFISKKLKQRFNKRLVDFPSVHRWVEIDDLLQNIIIRLSRVLVIPKAGLNARATS